ncbi:MAG: hypothetical protein B7Z55_06840, partial [Planctomycetales bacterium 12-60-4]
TPETGAFDGFYAARLMRKTAAPNEEIRAERSEANEHTEPEGTGSESMANDEEGSKDEALANAPGV